MPRIRTIKPEFWSSPGVTEMNPWARLTFIAMWNWADDFGRGTYEPRELAGFVFPREDDMTVKDFRTHVGEIHRHVGVVFYTVDERPYFEIQTWKKHQKTDPRLKHSKHPSPDEGVRIDPESMQVIEPVEEPHGHVGVLHPHVGGQQEHVGVGTGEQGNRAGGHESPPHDPPGPGDEPSEIPPSFDSLDSLADGYAAEQGDSIPYGTPQDPRCYEHRHLDKTDVPPCFKCKRARDMWAEQDTTEKSARRQAIDNCDHCDDSGWIPGTNPAQRCTHQPQPTAANGPF